MKTLTKASKLFASLMVALVSVSVLASCGDSAQAISVLTREDGSGTRSAFTELFKIEDENKKDQTVDSASVTNNTSVMLTSVAQDEEAIGYISLGALNSSVKALAIDGVNATVANVIDGSYKIKRPFNIATKGSVETTSTSTQEFIKFIDSVEGQAVVDKEGYISETATESYAPTAGVEGKVEVGGSSSVSPLMEKLIEAFKTANPAVKVELQTSDSTTGINGAVDGTFDIGMASRELKDSEVAKGLVAKEIAIDGLAVIVNLKNEVSALTSAQVKEIYTGEKTAWADFK